MSADSHPLPRNAWYAVGGSDLLLPGMARAVSLFGEDIALWRAASGEVHAWANRCPHRGMRLSFGMVRGDSLVCRYHGWCYGGDGQCRSIPAHPDSDPPKAAKVPAFSAADSQGLLWVAVEEPTAPLPDLPELAFAQSVVFSVPAESVAEALPDLTFTGAPVRCERLGTGLLGLTERSDAPETRLLALQPMDETTCSLHVLTSRDDADGRRAAALWARRLRWFQTQNDTTAVVSLNPWVSASVSGGKKAHL